MTETLFEVSLAEELMLGEACHAVCEESISTDRAWAICGRALRGEDASPDDILCPDCIETAEGGVCRHCKTSECYGLRAARF